MRPNEKRIEQWLDSALREYGATEARQGLEGRIAARLAAESVKVARRRWWVLAGAIATVAAVVGLGLDLGTPGRTSKEAAVSQSPLVHQRPGDSDRSTIASSPQVNRPKASKQRKHAGPSVSIVELRQLPRREVFPSRQPSEQYRLLAEYVQQTPAGEVASRIAQTNRADLHIQNLDIAPISEETPSSRAKQTN
jgi:hypothetical protein